MNQTRLKTSLYLIVIISAFAFFGLAYFKGVDLSNGIDFFKLVPSVVTIDFFVILVFVRWGWDFKLFRGWFVPFPNLSGSWIGLIYSDWKNPETGQKPPPIPVMLTIKQSFFHTSCRMCTSEMESFSYAEGFLINPEKQIKNVAYSYTSKPRISLNQRSTSHDGTAIFQIVEKPEPKLVGRYWTERQTTGEIVLKYHSKELLEEIPAYLGLHPITEDGNRR